MTPKSINAGELQRSLGRVLDRLERGGTPMLIARRGTPAAALVSLKDYRERFADQATAEDRQAIVTRIRQLDFPPTPNGGMTTLDLLQKLRGSG